MNVGVLEPGVWFKAVLTNVTRLSVNQRRLDSALKNKLEVYHNLFIKRFFLLSDMHAVTLARTRGKTQKANDGASIFDKHTCY